VMNDARIRKLENSFRGRGRQAMHLPCKQAHVGALPTGSTLSEVISEAVINRSVSKSGVSRLH
jgi:hypothetical protein